MNIEAPIRILLVDDSRTAAILLRTATAAIPGAGFAVTHVTTLAEAQSRLAGGGIDVVLLDLGLSTGNGLDALQRVQCLAPDVPIVALTETDDDALGLNAVEAGASDYLPRHQLQTSLLGRALRHAIERQRAATMLRESGLRLTGIVDSAMDAIISVDEQQHVVEFNPAAEKMFGYKRDDVLGQSLDRFIPSRYRSARAVQICDFTPVSMTHRMKGAIGGGHGLRSDNTEFPIEASLSRVEVGGHPLQTAILRDISARNRAEEQLRESRKAFRQLASTGADHYWELDAQLRFTAVSPDVGLCAELDYASYLGKTRWDLPFLGVSEMRWSEHRRKLDAREPFRDFAGAILNSFGEERWFLISGNPLFDHDGFFKGYRGVSRDITNQKEKELKIVRLKRIYTVLSAINAAILRNRDRGAVFAEMCRIAVVDGAFTLAWISEIDPDTLKGNAVAAHAADPDDIDGIQFGSHQYASSDDAPASLAAREMRPVICNDVDTDERIAPIRAALLARGHAALAAFPLIVDGRAAAVLSLHAGEKSFFDVEEVALLNELANDVARGLEFIAKDAKVDYLTCYDALTGLPNSKLFRDRLAQFLSVAAHEDRAVTLYLIDLDRFTLVNDTLGRRAGDTLLQLVAERLNSALPNVSILARVSADTFAMAVPGLAAGAESSLAFLQNHIIASLNDVFMIEGNEIRVAARAGIALSPVDGSNAEALFKNAEAALMRARDSTERYLFYSPEMNARMADKLMLESELRIALAADQFVLHYQPIVELSSGQIAGAEALIRWQHPQKGLLSPAHFLSVVEDSDMSIPLGAWVLQTACTQLRKWQEAGLPQMTVSVNLSARQFGDDALVQRVADTLERTGLEARWLGLELTEDIVMENPERFIAKLDALKALGARLSLDDFGTGYSSLSYLKRFPLDQLKVDQSFIRDVTSNPDDAAIVKAVISVGNSMGLELVVEGVETEAQLAWLRRQRCEKIQGYFFSRPLSATAFETILRERKSLPPAADGASIKSKTLLVVDDESNIVAAVVRLLRRDGYRILTANSATEAFELLALNDVQVILSDHRMPVMTGAEFLGKVKNMYPDTVRILFSGYVEMEALIDAVNRGAVFRLLLKPWDDGMLREGIRDAFRYYWLTHRQDGSLIAGDAKVRRDPETATADIIG